MKRSEIAFGVLRIPVDMLAGGLGFFVAFLIRSRTDLIPGVSLPVNMPTMAEFAPFLMWSSLGLVVLLALNGMYSLKNTYRLQSEFWRMCYIATIWMGCIVGYYFLIRDFFPSRLLLIYGWILAAVFLMCGRWGVRVVQQLLVKRGIGIHRVAIIGKNKLGQEVERMFKEGNLYRVVATIADQEESWKNLSLMVENDDIDMVVLTTQLVPERLQQLINLSLVHHIRLRFLPDVLNVQQLALESTEEGGMPFMEVKPSPLDGWGRVWKRAMDIVGALLAIVFFSILWIPTAIAVWIQMKSFKEILFKQKRYGQYGKLFRFYKFQSMYVGAIKEHKKLMEQQQGERKGLLKIENDPRVTPVGRFIRKTSLDELPQLWNVLKGEMSLVGPRPHMPAEVDEVAKRYKPILHMKPGITGLPQVSGRSTLSFDDEMRLDMYYLEHWSLWMDLVILFRTVAVVLLRKDVS